MVAARAGAAIIVLLALLQPTSQAQTVQGRVVQLPQETPGRYTVTVRQIGWKTWQSPPFDLASAQSFPLVLRVKAEPYTLPEITVETGRPRCGIRVGEGGPLGGNRRLGAVRTRAGRGSG